MIDKQQKIQQQVNQNEKKNLYNEPSYDINTTIILFLLFKLAQEQILQLVRKVGDEHKLDADLVKIIFELKIIMNTETHSKECNIELHKYQDILIFSN